MAVLALTACVDAPHVTAPTSTTDPQGELLAETFDAMSRASAQAGDLARSDGFTHAALAIRGGVSPSRLEVQTGASSEAYDAFVSAATWDSILPSTMRPPARRTLIGWRRSDAGGTRIIAITAPSDSAPVMSPLSLGPGTSTTAVFAAGSAMQNEVNGNSGGYSDFGTAWYGTNGWVKLQEVAVLGTCTDSARAISRLGMSQCEQARYLVRFELTMQRLSGRPPQPVPNTPPHTVSTVGEPVVNGIRIRFSCANPSGDHGCR